MDMDRHLGRFDEAKVDNKRINERRMSEPHCHYSALTSASNIVNNSTNDCKWPSMIPRSFTSDEADDKLRSRCGMLYKLYRSFNFKTW